MRNMLFLGNGLESVINKSRLKLLRGMEINSGVFSRFTPFYMVFGSGNGNKRPISFTSPWLLLGAIGMGTLLAGCTSQPQTEEPGTLNVTPVVNYYFLGSYTGNVEEGFYAIAGDLGAVKDSLKKILSVGPARTTFSRDESINLVVFRGVFNTGGHGIEIDRVEKAGSTFVVHATYTDPRRGMMATQAFTQPTAIIPIGKLSKGSYEARLKVTKIVKSEKEDRIIQEDEEHASTGFVVE